jgi:hypothetical protein
MDTKQINYAVIRGLRNDIPAEVTKLQKAGWITAGGVHVTIDGVGAAQAMVLPAPEKKVTDYVLASEDSTDGLEKSVNAMLHQGWSLHGGPATSTHERQMHGMKIQFTRYTQAMVKYSTN